MRLSLGLLVLVTCACGGNGSSTDDAGTRTDAGVLPSGDGGVTSSDGGVTPKDGGMNPTDAGVTAGVATFLRVGMYDRNFTAGANDAQHVLFNEGAAERVVYGTCSAHCAAPASWSLVTLASVTSLDVVAVGAEGVGIDAAGRVHVLISGVPSLGGSANRAVYATCAGSCTQAENWSLVDLTPVAQGDPIGTNETFMVAPDGAISFLTQGQQGSFSARYVGCTSGCGALSGWSAGNVLDGNPLYARRDGAGVIHILFDQGDTAMGDGLHFYGRCAANCSQGASWQISPLGFIYNGFSHTAAFAVTPAGRVLLAYNQGNAAVATGDNGKLFVNSCSGSSCLDLDMWTSFSVGALEDGSDGAALATDGEAVLLAYTSGFELQVRGCASGCESAAAWSGPLVVDSATAMNAAVPPDTGSACPGTSESASWWPNRPAIGVGTSGVSVGHSPYAIVKCSGNPSPSRMPTIGRIFSDF